MDAYLSKPIDRAALESTLSALLPDSARANEGDADDPRGEWSSQPAT
jgi:hypothetical protein